MFIASISVCCLGLFTQFVLKPACQSEHGDTDRQSHAEEESQKAGAGANDDKNNEDCPKDYTNHNFEVLIVPGGGVAPLWFSLAGMGGYLFLMYALSVVTMAKRRALAEVRRVTPRDSRKRFSAALAAFRVANTIAWPLWLNGGCVSLSPQYPKTPAPELYVR